ncbi:MAG: hypothetical protein M1818_001840 [Claussenomyces sp. TS43310]|nr:MAG: hypothetical protein M1818_001840 [Claussenomyces sp. TS43310]
MLARFSTVAKDAKALGVSEFFEGLWRICGPAIEWDASRRNGTTIGLAISGGVDSMALALLCSKLPKWEAPRPAKLSFHAFVVDHGARQGSGEEAEAVAEALRGLKLPTDVLKIQWPNHVNPAALSDFESQARRSRFRILGRACRRHDIRHLCLAHHEDDQAETLMMRLAVGHRALGLQGIRPLAEVAECVGVYGVYQSGDHDRYEPQPSRKTVTGGRTLVQIENGGIQLVRPLLKYRKDRLKTTCEQERLPWFEDHTNADPSVTKRNAVRQIYVNHTLPKALSKPALLSLSERLQIRQAHARRIVEEELLSRYETLFEPSSGILWIRCRGESTHHERPTPDDLGDRGQHYRQAHALFLRAAVECVSPANDAMLSSLGPALRLVFPEFIPVDEIPRRSHRATTVRNVFIERIGTPSSEGKNYSPNQVSIPNSNCVGHGYEWRLSRQTSSNHDEVREPILVIPPMHAMQKLQDEPGVEVEKSGVEDIEANKWQLWDGRFWMSVSNLTQHQLRVRRFRRDDMAPFRKEFEKRVGLKRTLERRLATLAPDESRFTLPGIVKVLPDGSEKVVALPSLQLTVPGEGTSFVCKIRYKKISSWFTRRLGSPERTTRSP